MSRFLRVFVALMAAAVVLAGCGRLEENRRFMRGIGTNLYTNDLAEETRLLEIYFGYICAQAGIISGYDQDGLPQCNYSAFARSSSAWNAFVTQGLNDIDRRCDAYLAWLDNKRRSREPKIKQISDIGTATQAIMSFTGSNPTALDVVGVAFGLIVDSVANYHSRLLLEIEGSSVQAVVFRERTRLRSEINAINFTNKPEAYHAIRSYLNVCLPHTIETEINNTITVEKRTGTVPRTPLVNVESGRSLRAGTRVTYRPDRLERESAPNWSGIGDIIIDVPTAKAIQRAICLPENEIDGIYGKRTETALKVFESLFNSSTFGDAAWRDQSVSLSDREIRALRSVGSCSAGAKNYLENKLLSQTRNRNDLITINKNIRTQFNLPEPASGQTFVNFRAQIKLWRDMLGLNENVDEYFNDQITPDFIDIVLPIRG